MVAPPRPVATVRHGAALVSVGLPRDVPQSHKRIVRRTVPAELPAFLRSQPPALARVFAARAVRKPEELDLSLGRLPAPSRFKGMEEAVELLVDAIEADARILFIGDYDADGATSCALGVSALRALGAAQVSYLVPNRLAFGYGLTPEIVEVAAFSQPDLLVTVDNGIASHDGVRAAAERGMSVLVTDHHLPAETLPAADAIVNPNQPGDGFPSKCLAGVGVLFYVLLSLRTRLRTLGWFATQGIPEPNLADYLDLVAIGTVADVVSLDHTNRILVAQGVARINAGRCRPGVKALLEVARRPLGRIVNADLGFGVGPRLNAAGRLEDMSAGIECLLADEDEHAKGLARELDRLNAQRRDIEAGMQQQALEAVAALHLEQDSDLPRGLCLFHRDWHQGVVGLVASRIRERFDRPVVAFAPSGDEELRGSARSVPGLHIRDVLSAVATRSAGLIERFGGHAMAAGLTLKNANLEPFRRAFEEEVCTQLGSAERVGDVLSDGELDTLDLQTAELLRAAAPWGAGFPEPVFDGTFEVLARRVLDGGHLKLRLKPTGAGGSLDAIAFRAVSDGDDPVVPQRIRAAYRLDVNEYRGQRSPQLVIEYLEPCQ